MQTARDAFHALTADLKALEAHGHAVHKAAHGARAKHLETAGQLSNAIRDRRGSPLEDEFTDHLQAAHSINTAFGGER